MEKLLSLQEVCSILGCKDPKGRYVRNLRDRGLLKAARFGRNLMFTEKSVEEFIEKQFAQQNKKVGPLTRGTHGDDVNNHSTSLQLYHKEEQ